MDPTTRWLSLQHSAALPAPLLAAAFDDGLELATTQRDDRLLVSVAARADIPAECLDRLTDVLDQLDPAAVRFWTPTVEAALNHTHVPAALLQRIAQMHADGAELFGVALMEHPAALTPAQAARILTSSRTRERALSVHQLLARCGPEAALRAALSYPTPAVFVRQLLKYPVPVQDLVTLIETREGCHDLLEQMWAYRPWLHADELAEMVAVVADHTQTTSSSTWEPGPGPAVTYPMLEWDLTPVRFDAPRVHQPVTEMVANCASSDPDVALAAGRLLLSSSPYVVEDVVARGMAFALTNGALSSEQRAQLVQHALGCGVDGRYLDCLDVVTACPSMAPAWAAAHPTAVLERHGWEPFGGRRGAPTVLARMRERCGQHQLSDDEAKRFINRVAELGLDQAVLDGFGCSDVDLLRVHVRPALAGPAQLQVGQYLQAHLHTPAQWAAFADLWPTFTGTLGELMAVCAGLTSP